MFNIEKYWGFELETNDQLYINTFNEQYYMSEEYTNVTNLSQVVTSGVIDFFPTSAFPNEYHMKTVLKKPTAFHHQSYLGHFNGFKSATLKINMMKTLKAWHLGNPKKQNTKNVSVFNLFKNMNNISKS